MYQCMYIGLDASKTPEVIRSWTTQEQTTWAIRPGSITECWCGSCRGCPCKMLPWDAETRSGTRVSEKSMFRDSNILWWFGETLLSKYWALKVIGCLGITWARDHIAFEQQTIIGFPYSSLPGVEMIRTPSRRKFGYQPPSTAVSCTPITLRYVSDVLWHVGSFMFKELAAVNPWHICSHDRAS